jgi:outer membrane autotransporter protein
MVDQKGGYIALGIDRSVAKDAVLGIQLQYEDSDSESFGGVVSVDTSTISVGPYVSVLLNENWSASGLLTFGQVKSDVQILGLDGSIDRRRTSAVFTATGQYEWGSLNLRPQASLDYTYTSAGDLQLDGTLQGSPVSVVSEVQSGWSGTFSPSVEINRVFVLQDVIMVPFAEIGAIYSFGESGGILSNAQGSSYEDWMGTLRVGTRVRTGNGLFVEASLGYNSLFENDLESLDAGLYLSWSF